MIGTTRRLRTGALIGLLVVLAVAAAGSAIFLNDPLRPVPPPAPANPLTPSSPDASAFSWRLTAALSAHRALVLEVETTRPSDASAISQQLTEMYRDRFDEILVYFFQPNAKPRLAFVRVQWTREHGYRMLTLRPAPKS